MHILQCIEYNAQNTMQIIQCTDYNECNTMHLIQCIEYRAQTTMHRIQFIEYNAQNTMDIYEYFFKDNFLFSSPNYFLFLPLVLPVHPVPVPLEMVFLSPNTLYRGQLKSLSLFIRMCLPRRRLFMISKFTEIHGNNQVS